MSPVGYRWIAGRSLLPERVCLRSSSTRFQTPSPLCRVNALQTATHLCLSICGAADWRSCAMTVAPSYDLHGHHVTPACYEGCSDCTREYLHRLFPLSSAQPVHCAIVVACCPISLRGRQPSCLAGRPGWLHAGQRRLLIRETPACSE